LIIWNHTDFRKCLRYRLRRTNVSRKRTARTKL